MAIYKQLEFLALFLKHRPTLRNLSDKIDSPVISNTDPEDRTSESGETTRTANMEKLFAVYDDSQVMTAAPTTALPRTTSRRSGSIGDRR